MAERPSAALPSAALPDALPDVLIATDGACKGNPGRGGWAAILRHGDTEKILSGAEAQTTNNRMEMMAVLRALEALRRPSRVTLQTDSRYLVDGMTRWLPNWKRNGWKNAQKKPVANADLWLALEQAARRHRIDYQWVRGHAGHPLNERADRLANEAVETLLP